MRHNRIINGKTINADKESRKELMGLIKEKIDTDLDSWELTYENNNNYIFNYEKDNYKLIVSKHGDNDVKYKLKENRDTINIMSSGTCKLAFLILTMGLPLLFLSIPTTWGVYITISTIILSSLFVIFSFLNDRKNFVLLKKEFKRRSREILRQRIIGIDNEKIIENFPIERVV